MAVLEESQTREHSESEDKFIQDDGIRIDGYVVTEIESIEKCEPEEDEEYGTVKMYVKAPRGAGPWTYDMKEVLSGDNRCWIIELAEERGYDVQSLDKLEGDMIYVRNKPDKDCWSAYQTHPREKFSSNRLDARLLIKDGERTVVEREDKQDIHSDESANQLEIDCVEYETLDEYLICEIDRIIEIECEGICNIVRIEVDTPYGGNTWDFKKPYQWSDENPLVQLADSRGYGKINFTSLVGDDVLVKREDGTWKLDTTPVSEYRTTDKDKSSSILSLF